MRDDPCLWLVVPCYNEQAVLPITAPLFLRKLAELSERGAIGGESRVLFVDDGSTDDTWEIIEALAARDERCLGLRLSRNWGQQNALLAGLTEATAHCDVTITADCDGQDDPDAMDAMLEEYRKGSEVVYGVRRDRGTDTPGKRLTAEAYYKTLRGMGAEVVYNHADYRLLSARVLRGLAEYGETNLFLRGLVPLVGFPSATVAYDRRERLAGVSRYPARKMLVLALDGVTSLTTRPITLIAALGVVISAISFCGIVWAVVRALMGQTVNGWASTICVVCFLSGVQLLSLGVIGQYVGKTYLEAKRRPRYLVRERTWDKRQQ